MTSERDFEKLLNNIPSDYPYELVQLLREAHRLLHQPDAVGSVIHFSDAESMIHALRSFEPTKLALAREKLERVNQIIEVNLGRQGNNKALEIAYKMSSRHILPDEINHSL